MWAAMENHSTRLLPPRSLLKRKTCISDVRKLCTRQPEGILSFNKITGTDVQNYSDRYFVSIERFWLRFSLFFEDVCVNFMRSIEFEDVCVKFAHDSVKTYFNEIPVTGTDVLEDVKRNKTYMSSVEWVPPSKTIANEQKLDLLHKHIIMMSKANYMQEKRYVTQHRCDVCIYCAKYRTTWPST